MPADGLKTEKRYLGINMQLNVNVKKADDPDQSMKYISLPAV